MNNGTEKKTASLIFWSSSAGKERIEKWIKNLQARGFIEGSTTREYDPNIGEPVWYIP